MESAQLVVMSLRSSDMARGALGTAFSLLLLASSIQGLPDVEVFHYERMDAVVGQNVTLPCIVKNSPTLTIVSIEWRKNNKHKNSKVALYSPDRGFNLFWPNVTMQIEKASMGSHLQLYGVTTQDSGIYICDISSFPQGSISSETVLEIKDDVIIMCDVDRAVEVHSAENVTIKCKLFPDAKYKWTKNKTLVSENESLELWCVADAHAGVYTLSVNTGNKSLHKEFIITVLTATTSLRTDLATVPPQSNVTEEGLIESADSSLTTSPTTGLSTTDANVASTMNMSTDVKDDNPNSRNTTAEEHMTPLTNSTHVSVTLSPITHTEPNHFNSSNDQEINPTSVASNLSTTSSYGNEVFRSTYGTKNESMEGNPDAASTLSTGNTTIVIEGEGDTFDPGAGGAQSHLLWLFIVPILVLIAAAGFLCFRRKMRERMNLPPSFKPPPPPFKYTAARHHEISTQPIPTSRCNSVT
ncbi:T-cell surface protein tactile [Anarrhichthys ocellatus]|uniref:T-cell surface protein tactile n=1 Tax=Anarrhichthys ocellatus TaxID=433405 RepID=UPI0012EE51E5|nr:T-cell surface protein tactile-like [Anarrhichthys ocellatus]